MSFLSKFKTTAIPASPNLKDATKNGQLQLLPTALDKHIADLTGPARLDGSDKFFGFENYSSTCYCNSILQCLYYSTDFRDHVINFPPQQPQLQLNGTTNHTDPEKHNEIPLTSQRSPLLTKPPPSTPGPLAASSPARKPLVFLGSPQAQGQKADEKDSPEWKKKVLMQSAPMLDMQLNYSETYGMQESLFTAIKDIFDAIISQPTRTGIVSPHKFLETLRKENEMFRSAMHQDAHEFLNLLLNQIVDTIELYTKQHGNATIMAEDTKEGQMTGMVRPTALTQASTGWVHDLFEGLLVSETRCLTCETTSQRDEAFMDLSVDLEGHSSVTSCLRKFSEEEMLCERNKFHCDNCGGLQEAEKRMKIKRLPKILALHLKRFKYTEDFNRLQKLFHRVVYPFHLRLFNTTDDADDQDRMYELYAVVVHIGGGPYHGHYVSIIKTQDRGWLLFDDELVEPVSKEYVLSFFGGEARPGVQDAKQLACAYVLFYQETTLEKIKKEQEAEVMQAEATAAAAARAHDAASPTSPRTDHSSSLWSNGFRMHAAMATPIEEKDDQMAALAHAMTVPSVPSEPVHAISESDALMPQSTIQQKTKKDLKKEEKQAKTDRKAAEKEAEKQRRDKSKVALETRRDRMKRAEEELQAALEASKATKAEEDSRTGVDGGGTGTGTSATGTNGDPAATPEGLGGGLHHAITTGELREISGTSPNLGASGTSTASGGLGVRFRHGSVSLRQKKGFWGARKDGGTGPAMAVRDEEVEVRTVEPVPAVPTTPVANGAAREERKSPALRSVPSSPGIGFGAWRTNSRDATKDTDKEGKKNRFSMGKKKVAAGS